MSDENNETVDEAGDPSQSTGEAVPSIFDLFEPPPEIDHDRFGPIPVVTDSVLTDQALPDGDVAEEPVSNSDVASSTSESDGLLDWTAPATGQVPAVLATTKSDLGWSDLDGPRWHGEDPEWGAEDLSDVFSDMEGVAEPKMVTFDDVAEDMEDIPAASGAPQRTDRETQRPPRVRQRPNTNSSAAAASASGERNVTQAIAVGLAIAAFALFAIRLESHWLLLAIVTAAAAVGASEFYFQLHQTGLRPATLLGITATASMPLSVYYRGEAAYPMVLALCVIFGALWFIVGAEEHKPVVNMALTIFGVAWIGILGSFAVLLFKAPNTDGHGLLLAAIVVAVASDTGAFAFGSWFGKTPFHSASKNKTWEGTLGGVFTAVAAALVLYVLSQTPFQASWRDAIALGLVGGILGPIGDLTESLIKRDLGIKDMGTLIPGHGGVLDRVDGILFVLPGVYYLALMLDYV